MFRHFPGDRDVTDKGDNVSFLSRNNVNGEQDQNQNKKKSGFFQHIPEENPRKGRFRGYRSYYAVSELFGSIAGSDGSNIDAVHQLFNVRVIQILIDELVGEDTIQRDRFGDGAAVKCSLHV